MNMTRTMMAVLFTAAITFGPVALAQTPSIPTAPPLPAPDKEQPSNKGGQLRGLDRADQAAGEHGQQGRDRARDAQLNQPNPFDRTGLPDRPVRPDRPGR
jgi:hypothetical protein